MKQLIQLCCLLLLWGFTLPPVQAQDSAALAIIQRYEQVSGMDKITDTLLTAWHLESTANLKGTQMKIDIYSWDSTNLYTYVTMKDIELEMFINGENECRITMNGEQVTLPQEMAQMMRNQLISPDYYRWQSEKYHFSLADSIQIGKHLCPGVRITPKQTIPGLNHSVVYFEPKSGMPVLLTTSVTENGITHQIHCTFEDVKDFGVLKLPSRYVMTIDQQAEPITDITIHAMEYGVTPPASLLSTLK